MRLALIADSHLSPRAPECVANWHAASRAVEQLGPELTIHLGDISLDGHSHPDDLEFAAELVNRWPTRMLCVPGNHDVGDGCGERAHDRLQLTLYERLFGADHWRVCGNGWELCGLNAQRLGAGGEIEESLYRWLGEPATSSARAPARALFIHRPLRRVIGSDPKTTGRYVPPASADRLWSALYRRPPALVVSGHVHQHLDVTVDGVRHLWLPSSAFVLPEATQPSIGRKFVGISMLELAANAVVRFDSWTPKGMVGHDLQDLEAFQSLM